MKCRAIVILFCLPIVSVAEQPRLEPLFGAPPHPADNPPSAAKTALGEELFFERMLSGNNRRSCGACHKPELNFSDGLSRAWGLNESELERKTPVLLNVGWQRSMFFDGRVKTLEEQVAKPLENHLEMDLDPAQAAARIKADPHYARAFAEAFPGEPIDFDLIAKAIAAYERTLVSYDSDLDRYLLGDAQALEPAAKRGMDLFSGKARCIGCHHGPLLTDHGFHYNGVAERDGHGAPGTKYKTQSLRGAARRYSFMHNGSLLNLRQVLDHYDRGGSAPAGFQAEIRPLRLTDDEKNDLTAFLQALNGRVNRLTDQAPPTAAGGSSIRRAPARDAPTTTRRDGHSRPVVGASLAPGIRIARHAAAAASYSRTRAAPRRENAASPYQRLSMARALTLRPLMPGSTAAGGSSIRRAPARDAPTTTRRDGHSRPVVGASCSRDRAIKSDAEGAMVIPDPL